MTWAPALRALRLFGIAVVLTGVAGVALGVAGGVDAGCEPGYALTADPVDGSTTGGGALAYANLTDRERAWFRAARNGTTEFVEREALPPRLVNATVVDDGRAYRVRTVVHDCGRSAGTLFAVVGGGVLVVGLLVVVAAQVLLGRADDPDRRLDPDDGDPGDRPTGGPTYLPARSRSTDMADRTRAHVFVSGKVQGVYYRATTRDRARDEGVHGWVKNLADGRVEAVFEGPEDAVEAMVEWCHTGSPAARVEDVEVEYGDPEGLAGFEVRY